jgi:hypothetical protein
MKKGRGRRCGGYGKEGDDALLAFFSMAVWDKKASG